MICQKKTTCNHQNKSLFRLFFTLTYKLQVAIEKIVICFRINYDVQGLKSEIHLSYWIHQEFHHKNDYAKIVFYLKKLKFFMIILFLILKQHNNLNPISQLIILIFIFFSGEQFNLPTYCTHPVMWFLARSHDLPNQIY